MEFYNFFKSFLGIPNSVPPNNFDSLDDDITNHEGLRRPDEEDFDSFSFDTLMNPLEMHRFLDQQINAVMRAFGTQTEQFFGDTFNEENNPAILPPSSPSSPENLREHYLKPGYEYPKDRAKADIDVDGEVDVAQIDTILKKSETKDEKPKRHFFGQSTSVKTVVRPDGSMETERIVRDNEGNEERTITRRVGDNETTVITKVDKFGRQEQESFNKIDDSGTSSTIEPSWKWFNFDRIFK